MPPAPSSLFTGSRSFVLPLGWPVFPAGQRVETVYMVKAGCVQLQRHTAHGAHLMLQNAGPGAVLAEAGPLAALTKPAFLAALRDDPDLALAWSAVLARAVQAARVQAKIRSRPRAADRLDAWLDEGRGPPEKGRWQEVAAELGVTREALDREMSRRRAGGCP